MSAGLLTRCAGLAAALLLASNAAAQPRPAAAPGEVIAILEDAAPAAEFIAMAESRGYALRFEDDLAGLDLEMITLGLPDGVDGPAAIEELEAAAPYSVVGVNHIYELAEAPMPRLFAEDAIRWPDHACRAAVHIGVIDTPVSADQLGLGRDALVSASFLRADEAPSRRDHGDAVAGIMAGSAGLLTDATLFVAVAVMDDGAGGALTRVDHLARSINWMAENDVKVVNLSLAGPRNKIFAKVVEAAARRGMILVAAVGNAGPDSPPLYPAAFEEVVAVTAVDAARRIYDQAVRGPHVDVAAPGVDIWLFGAEEQRYASGTSLAAPYVAARLAVAAAAKSIADVAAARRLLAQEAEDLGPAGRDPVFGDGLLRGPADCG